MLNNSLPTNLSKEAFIFNRAGHNPVILIKRYLIRILNSQSVCDVIEQYLITPSLHMDNINAKVCLTLPKLHNLKVYLSISIKLKFVHSLLMSHINYCVEVVNGCHLYNQPFIRSCGLSIICISEIIYLIMSEHS